MPIGWLFVLLAGSKPAEEEHPLTVSNKVFSVAS
jgi:hypothetical protein